MEKVYDEKKEWYNSISSWICEISDAEKHRTHIEHVINVFQYVVHEKHSKLSKICCRKYVLVQSFNFLS